jgi:hypothetical protein
MVKQSDEFRELARGILADRKLSLTEMAERAKRDGLSISYGTIRSMVQNGTVPGPELVVEFVRAAERESSLVEKLVNGLLDRAGIFDLRYVPDAVRSERSKRRGLPDPCAMVPAG